MLVTWFVMWSVVQLIFDSWFHYSYKHIQLWRYNSPQNILWWCNKPNILYIFDAIFFWSNAWWYFVWPILCVYPFLCQILQTSHTPLMCLTTLLLIKIALGLITKDFNKTNKNIEDFIANIDLGLTSSLIIYISNLKLPRITKILLLIILLIYCSKAY